MSLVKKIFTLITSLLMIFLAVDLFFEAEYGYYAVIVILLIFLGISAVQSVWYYFSMARHMVGGIFYFYRAVFLVDLTISAPILLIAPRWIMVLYLNGAIIFSGVIDILRATDQRKMMWPQWKLRMTLGVSKIILAVLAMIFMRSRYELTIIYSIGLIYTAIMRIIDAFRAKNIVYYTQ